MAYEATFSAGGCVIDPYRFSLALEIVQMLICTSDWCRSLHGVKRKNKVRTTCYHFSLLLFYNMYKYLDFDIIAEQR